MAKTVKLKLVKPIEIFGVRMAEIEVREPRGIEFMDIGDPFVHVMSYEGPRYSVEQPEKIKKYCGECIVHDHGSAMLSLLGLEDTVALKDLVLSFFFDVNKRILARNSTPSSSASAS